MLKIGITGGIGSGKSTVAKVIETLSYPVFYADNEAKNILDSNPIVMKKLIEHFGGGIYRESKIDRKKLAELVFNNKENIEIVNNIVHPEVRNQFKKWAERQNKALVFNEAAILFETGTYKQYDKNIIVVADQSTRIERVLKRDNISRDEVIKRINNQWKDEVKIPLADYIVKNDNQKPILIQIENIIQDLIMIEGENQLISS